jgi:uncharacterized secreted repeat protein (TIGR03808 family)
MFDRRKFIVIAASVPTIGRTRTLAARTLVDSTSMLQNAIDKAPSSGDVAKIPPGVSYVSHLRISGNLRLLGAGADSRLVGTGLGPMLTIERADGVAIENVGFDGGGGKPGGESGLIEARDVGNLSFSECRIERAAGYGLKIERCGGRIERSFFRGLSESAIWSIDGAGLSIADNRVEECGSNGIQVWRSAKGPDGTVIRDNRIGRVRADRGGDGPYGNAISVFRAEGVSCAGNIVRGAAFSAIRYNSSSNALITGNNCSDIGETAIYVEFGFEGAVVSSNVIDGASTGVSVTNFDQGGRLAAVTGNVMRNLTRPLPEGGDIFGIGIHVEADTAVTGNAVDNAGFAGLRLGYGVGLRDVVAADNVLSDCGFGIVVSVAPGAGGATIRDNRIARARRGTIVGMAWSAVASSDLVAEAAKYPALAISGNEVR